MKCPEITLPVPAPEERQWLEAPEPERCLCLYMVKENERAPTAGLRSATVASKAARSSDSATVQLRTVAGTLKLSLFHFSLPLLTRLKDSYFTVLLARHPDSSLLQSASMPQKKHADKQETVKPYTQPYSFLYIPSFKFRNSAVNSLQQGDPPLPLRSQ